MAAPAQKTKVSPDTWIKLGVYVAGGVALAFGVKKVLDYFKPDFKREESESKQVQSELEQSEKTEKQSYPDSVYSGWASAIATAVFGAGTDEAAIFDIFRKLKNNTDYLKLIKAWGSPKRQVYPDWFVFYSTGFKMTLPEVLRYDMDAGEIKTINNILANKGIKYRV
jgi:hypothetical protein